ncbi:MAG: flippase-like domain-containing protein [Chloroflexi bacterium]|nr:flippase-like domain-containing protein [Chloroflexota bacterium]
MSQKTRQILRIIGLVIFLLVGVKILFPHIKAIPDSINAIRGLDYWMLFLAVFFEVLRFVFSGYFLNTILGLFRERIPLGQAMMIVLGSASFGMVAGGLVGSAAASLQWLRERNIKTQAASMAGFLPIIFNNIAVLIISLVGVIYLFGLDALTSTQLNAFIVIFILLVGVLFLFYLFLRDKQKSKRFSVKFMQKISSLTKKNFEERKIAHQVDEIFMVRDKFFNRGWIKPVLGTILSYLSDLLALFSLFLAAGQTISPQVLLIGYGLPQLLGKATFILPGGIGVVESTMIALFEQLGIADHIAVVVVIAFRFLSFIIPTILGFILVFVLQNHSKYEKRSGI